MTFTDKAAGVMKRRLAALGVEGVEARTFHSAALGAAPPLRARLGRADPADQGAAPAPDREHAADAVSVPAGRAISRPRSSGRRTAESRPRRYLALARRSRAADPGRPDGDGLPRVRAAQGRARARSTSRTCSSSPSGSSRADEQARADLRERYRAFTVDEYQDVNLLQQTLLDLWLGARDDLCVVGDDYQSIYAFTGASPALAARDAGAVPGCDGRAARGQLPLDARRCSRSRTGSCRRLGGRREGAAGDAASGPEPAVRRVRDRRGGRRMDRGRG